MDFNTQKGNFPHAVLVGGKPYPLKGSEEAIKEGSWKGVGITQDYVVPA